MPRRARGEHRRVQANSRCRQAQHPGPQHGARSCPAKWCSSTRVTLCGSGHAVVLRARVADEPPRWRAPRSRTRSAPPSAPAACRARQCPGLGLAGARRAHAGTSPGDGGRRAGHRRLRGAASSFSVASRHRMAVSGVACAPAGSVSVGLPPSLRWTSDRWTCSERPLSMRWQSGKVRLVGECGQAAWRYSWTSPPRMSTRSMRRICSTLAGVGVVSAAGTSRPMPRWGRAVL
jgi:hypothetical protein